MTLIEIDVRDYLSGQEWADLRKEALAELLQERGPKTRHFITDLIDARSAILGRRYDDALLAIERAISEVKEG